MGELENAFVTNNRKDYQWPYEKKLTLRPTQPPSVIPRDHSTRPFSDICYCEERLYDPMLKQYGLAGEKEALLCKELYALHKRRVELSNMILEHPCDNDDVKMESIYQMDFKVPDDKIVKYRPIRAAIDAPEGSPTKSKGIKLSEGFRDPCSFRYQAFVRPRLGADGPVSMITTPNSIEAWFTSTTPQTEYQNTHSKMGFMNLRNLQQYREPMPSSRRRIIDTCLQ